MDRSATNSVNDAEDRRSEYSPPPLPRDSAANDDDDRKRKHHRRGKKKTRPKWKPYSKMNADERKALEKWEDSRTASKVADIAARSRRPIAPFNTTQFLMEDRQGREDQVRLPMTSLARSVSYDSSLSGGACPFLTPPISPNSLSPSFPPLSLLRLGDDAHFEPSDDEDLKEQDAFLEADFNQVYIQLQMEKFEQMTKHDLIQRYFTIEDSLSSVEREREKMANQMDQMACEIKALCDENQKLRNTINSGVVLDTISN